MHDDGHESRLHDLVPSGPGLQGSLHVKGDAPAALGGHRQAHIDELLFPPGEGGAGLGLGLEGQKGVCLARVAFSEVFDEKIDFVKVVGHGTSCNLGGTRCREKDPQGERGAAFLSRIELITVGLALKHFPSGPGPDVTGLSHCLDLSDLRGGHHGTAGISGVIVTILEDGHVCPALFSPLDVFSPDPSPLLSPEAPPPDPFVS